jgi:2,3-dihydroxybenzoate decarboxylase
MHGATVRSQRYESTKPIKRKPSGYLRETFHITIRRRRWRRATPSCVPTYRADRVAVGVAFARPQA